MTRSEGIFPSRAWVIKRGRGLPVWKGTDEWGRHTIVLQIPFLVGVVVATRRCRCDDCAQFACAWLGCPYQGMVAGEFCPTHDHEWLYAA